MVEWIEQNREAVVVVLIALASALLAATIVFAVLWGVSRRRRRVETARRIDVERELLDTQLSLAEQTGRLRIIRELHEVAAHSMSVIIGQADGARYVAETDPGVAQRTAIVIADTARSTLADLRRVMTAVRDGEASVEPQPQLKSLRELFRIMRDAGLEVEFEESGSRFDLAHGAELAVYRILQEALANALKHGGEGATARVRFTWTDDGLQVLVEDDGERAAIARAGGDPDEAAQQRPYTIDDDVRALTEVVTGRGMTEMRERTELFGGVFNAFSVPGVGFTVSAIFPALRYHNGVHGVRLEHS